MPATTTSTRIMDYDNVNGVNLSLNLEFRQSSPKSLLVTVSYKSVKKKTWPIQSLVLAIIFNILAMCYVRISMRTMFIILIVLGFIIFFWVTHSVQSESILVIPTVGIQMSVKYVFGKEDSFVPWPSIDDVIINEVIKLDIVDLAGQVKIGSLHTKLIKNIADNTWVSNGPFLAGFLHPSPKQNRVLYFLTLLVKINHSNQDTENIKLIPLFKYTKPRLSMLERIYTELQGLLTERLSEGSGQASGDRA